MGILPVLIMQIKCTVAYCPKKLGDRSLLTPPSNSVSVLVKIYNKKNDLYKIRASYLR
jgi:hypothetical protein